MKSENFKLKISLISAFIVLSLIVVSVYHYLSFNDGFLHIVMCNVGQGEAIYIKTPSGADMLIDAGPDNSVLSCLNRHMPFFDRTIEVAVLTNADLDHYGGFIPVMRRYRVQQFVTNNIGKNDRLFESLEEQIQNSKTPVKIMSNYDILRDGKVIFTSLWPYRDNIRLGTPQEGRAVLGAFAVTESVNPYSLVLHLAYGQFDILLTGDIEPPSTDEVAAKDVEVLKIPHHGSKNGLTIALLEQTTPELAIISLGKNNRFGHPHKDILNMLSDKNIKILRTDKHGDIEIVSDGQKWWVIK